MSTKAGKARQRKLHWRRYGFYYELIGAIIVGIILIFVSTAKSRQPKEYISPVPTSTPTPAPIWIKLPDGSEYRSDICDRFAYFSTQTNDGDEYVLCPIEDRGIKEATDSAEIDTPTPTPIEDVVGDASYYSREGCIGCSENLIMANSQPLDDSALTVAYNRAPLNSYIEITNVRNGRTVTAQVTDRGGFEAYGKIADLSVATKNALECGDVCKVQINHL